MTDGLGVSAPLPGPAGSSAPRACARRGGLGIRQPRERREPRGKRPGHRAARSCSWNRWMRCLLSTLLGAIEKSNIPILVQAHDWAMLPESFHREIERDSRGGRPRVQGGDQIQRPDVARGCL